MEDADGRYETRLVATRTPRDQQHATEARTDLRDVDGERHEQAASHPQLLAPYPLDLRGGGVDEDRVERVAGTGAAVVAHHRDLCVRRQVPACPRRERRVDLHTDDAAVGRHGRGADGGVVADATPDVQHALPRCQVERVEPARQGCQLTVVELSAGIERDQHVGAQVARVGVDSSRYRGLALFWSIAPGPGVICLYVSGTLR